MWLKAGRTAWVRFQGREGEDLRQVSRTGSAEGFKQLPLHAQLLAPKLLLSDFSQKKTGERQGKRYSCISRN